MNCTPASILEASKCYCGLTSREDSSVSIYLLCQWANQEGGPVTCGTPGEYILISGAGSGQADGTYVHNPTSPNIWNSATDTQAYIRLFAGNYFLEYGLAAHQLYKTTGANWPCTWETDVEGTNPAPTGQWIAPPVSWAPSTELVTWNDSGGAHVGDLPTFLATADLITVSSLVFGATGNLTSLTGLKYLPSLATVDCNTNSLTSLDCTNCISLTTLNCSSNASLTTLTLTGCSALTTLNCSACNIGSLDVTTSAASLTALDCGNNGDLLTLDVTGCSILTDLKCDINSLTTLDVSTCISLINLNCNGGGLTDLDVSTCPNLKTLTCVANSLTTLDVTGCALLISLICSTNSILALDVSTCVSLQIFSCDVNPLTVMDISNCHAMVTFRCDSCSLTSINVTGCTAATGIFCEFNSLGQAAVDAVLCQTDANGVFGGGLSIQGNTAPSAAGLVCSANLDPGKGWTVTHD